METIPNVPMDQIHVDFEANARVTYDEAMLKELASSIKRDGLMHPIVVRRADDKDGTKVPFVLVAGYRRYKALNEILKVSDVDVRLSEASRLDAAILSFNENSARENLSTYEKARALVAIRDEFKLGPSDISKRLAGQDDTKMGGIKPTTISNFMRIWDKLDTRIKEGAWRNRHPQATLLCLLRIISDAEEGEDQMKLWLATIGEGVEDEDDDDDDDDDSETAGKSDKKSRPNVNLLHRAISNMAESEQPQQWRDGAKMALEWAAGLRKRLPGVNLEKPKSKKNNKKED